MTGALGAWMLGALALAPPQKSRWAATLFFGLAVLTKATAAFPVLLVIALERAMSLRENLRPRAARWLPWILSAAVLLSASALLCEMKGKGKHGSKRAKATAVARDPADDSMRLHRTSRRPKMCGTVLDGVLNKCALVLAISAVGIILVMAFRSERDAPALPRGWKLSLLLSISMGLWWYVLLIANQGWPNFWKLLSFELVGRVDGATHREGMHYYLLLLPAVTLPWAPGLFSALRSAWTPRDSNGGAPETGADFMLLAWVLGIVFFFSIPGAKLPTYVLPALPAIALLTARFLMRLDFSKHTIPRGWMTATQVIALVLTIGLFAFPSYFRWLPATVHQFAQSLPVPLWAFSTGTALLIPGAWLLGCDGRARLAGTIAGCGTFAVIFLASSGIINFLKPRSTKDLCFNVKSELNGVKIFKTIGVAPEGLSYYLDSRMTGSNGCRPQRPRAVRKLSQSCWVTRCPPRSSSISGLCRESLGLDLI